MFWYGGEKGWFKTTTTNLFNSADFPTPSTIQSFDDYEVKLEAEPNTVCLGDYATGRITSNMRNAGCRIFVSVNNQPWQQYRDVVLDNRGSYEETHQMLALGTARFITICCDLNLRCAISNYADLWVIRCDDDSSSDDDGYDYPPDEEGYYTCGQTQNGYDYILGNICVGTCPPGYECAEYQQFLHPFCACVKPGSGEVHPDWFYPR